MIGPHIIGSVSRYFDTLRRWQPRLILVLDPSPDQIHSLRQICPNAYIVGRIYRPDHEVDHLIRTNPKEAARWAHNLIMDRYSPDIDAWQVENEILQAGDGLPLLNEFALERMRLADAHGYKAAILAFSVGNPDLPTLDPMAAWRQVFSAITYAEQHEHVIAVHQYAAPTLSMPDADWYIHRLERKVLPLLPFSRVKFVCTEFGIDNMVKGLHSGPSGWMDSLSAPEYAQNLIDMGRYLERYRDRVIGYCVYTLGQNAPWQTYDIEGEVADRLATYYKANPQPLINLGIPEPIQEPVLPAAPPFQPREIAQVATACRVRSTPGLTGDPLGVFEIGFYVHIVAGPQEVDGLIWWKVHGVKVGGEQVLGWTAQQDPTGAVLLKKPDATAASQIQAPFDGRYRITQFFGEDPASYLRFDLRGHNGLDLGLPQGVLIKAVDAGWAMQVQLDPPGFGQFVKLQHTWGESLYAHLSSMTIVPGQQVAQGQVIGASGSTGNSTGPHLHFGIRINPYNQSDGWNGYSDPLPWLPPACYVPSFMANAEPDPVVQPPAPPIQRRLAPAFDVMNLEIRPLTPPADLQVVYKVKDVFTTQDGSWEVGQKPPPYGVQQWARDAYLKPWDAPDVFDDAGGSNHLFGAIIGLDGQLLRNHLLHWWTKDNQNRFEMRTKERSGWANLASMNADSAFWPQNAQSGPWCWAPEGAIEGVFGGGLPNQWHVSTFVVWQAVQR